MESNQDNTALIHQVDRLMAKDVGFSEYLAKSGIDPAKYREYLTEYIDEGKRCLRVRCKDDVCNVILSLKEVTKGVEVHPLMKNLVILPRTCKVNTLPIFKDKIVCGIEAASALVVYMPLFRSQLWI